MYILTLHVLNAYIEFTCPVLAAFFVSKASQSNLQRVSMGKDQSPLIEEGFFDIFTTAAPPP
jgi:hypothetical protein